MGGENMALEKLQRYARAASKKEAEVLDSLADYYRGDYSLGHVAETVNMPLRAVMEFMQRYRLPYYSDASDTEEGLRRISKIRSTI
ncbi:hypothetical protein A3K71_05565 [archaeon RBG_16_50_20]|nr:MAG: hypothetical protein A3K71_05565 [archaeon RBG_16_50_20]